MVLMSWVHHRFLRTVHTSERKFDHYLYKLEIPQRPNTTINIKAEIDMDSQPMEIETLYDPDMDTSDTSSDNIAWF